MDLLAELTSSLQSSIYVVLGFTAIGLCFAFVYYTGLLLGAPVGRKLVLMEKKGPDRSKPLTQKDEESAVIMGCMMTGLVFAILIGISAPQWAKNDLFMEGLLKTTLRTSVGEVVVMGFFRVLAGLLL